jgi:hypothetical protein
MQLSGWSKFKSLLQAPWNSIEHQVRNRIILTFISFSTICTWNNRLCISSWTVFWYAIRSLIESLWTVHSKNVILRPWYIPVSAAEALKFNRTRGTKPHNINFHVFFDYAPGITCFISSWTVFWYTIKTSTESLWNVDSKNKTLRPT